MNKPMELIKIDTDHFVVVDKTIQPVNGYYYDSFINKIKSTNGAEYGEASHCWQITHSTNIDWNDVYYIPLQEVKELIGEVDMEKKAEEYADFSNDYVPLTFGYKFNTNTKRDYLAGYAQALEDNKAKRYTEEDLKYMFECGRNYQNNAEITFKVSMEYLLQTKTSWQVEIVDGKLKLK